MRPDKGKPYYTAYDKRYRAVYEQGADNWLYLPEYEAIKITVREFVYRFSLKNKKVVDLGCGEGLNGLEFVKLGCIYHGYDISPAAIEKAQTLLGSYPNIQIIEFDIVNKTLPEETFDAGIDIACLHMLVIDTHRDKYLSNVFNCLKPGTPMMFTHERLCDVEYSKEVKNYNQWLKISGDDVDTPFERTAIKNGKIVTVKIPLIAARPRTEEGYCAELTSHGFEILEITKLDHMINILTRKPEF